MSSVKLGLNKFCGPSAISAIAGIDTDEAASLIRATRANQKEVRGVYLHEIEAVFQKLGYKTTRLPSDKGSLFATLFKLKDDGYYVIMVPHHFVTIEVNGNHKYLCDNHTKEPLRAGNSSRLGQRVVDILKVDKL